MNKFTRVALALLVLGGVACLGFHFWGDASARSRAVSLEEAEAWKARQEGGYIGVGLSFDEIAFIGDGLLVEEVEADSTAEAAGLHKGDLVTAVNGVPLKGLTWQQAREDHFAGRDGTVMRLRFLRGGKERELDVLRDLDERIGVEFSLAGPEQLYAVSRVVRAGPAEKAGLLEGDIVVAVDGKSIDGVSEQDFFSLLKSGNIGSQVTFSIRRQGESISLHVQRGIVQSWDLALGASYQGGGGDPLDPQYNRADLEIKNLDWAGMFSIFDRFVEDARDYPGAVLDLRDCSGENPEVAAQVAARFIDSDAEILTFSPKDGAPVTYRISGGTLQRVSAGKTEVVDTSKVRYTGRLVVLVNGGTSGTAESLALALQHNGRGILVGSGTGGRSTVYHVVTDQSATGAPSYLWTPAGHLTGPDGRELSSVSPDHRVWLSGNVDATSQAILGGSPWYFWPEYLNILALLVCLLLVSALIGIPALAGRLRAAGRGQDGESP